MNRTLVLHPTSHCDAVTGIEVEVTRPRPSVLRFVYKVTGDIAAVRWPAEAPPDRTDNLWHHTCCEAFVQVAGETSYIELNLSPSSRWAVYRFSSYREGMANVDEIGAVAIERHGDAHSYTLQTEVDLAPIAMELRPDAQWRLGISTIIEEAGGRLSYWALTHPSPKPDFHNADCFTLELGRASRA